MVDDLVEKVEMGRSAEQRVGVSEHSEMLAIVSVVLEIAREKGRSPSSALAEPLGIGCELVSTHGIRRESVADDLGVDVEPIGERGDGLGRRGRLDDELKRSIAERLSIGRGWIESEDLAEVDILVADDSFTNIDRERGVGA